MALIPKAAFPNVPKLPGVPQLPRSINFPPGPPPVLGTIIALGRLALALTAKPAWGIYLIPPPAPPPAEGELETVTITPAALVPDNFSRFHYTNESQVTSAPVQAGSFANYNKVANPFEVSLRMTKGGSLKSRQQFLTDLDAIANSIKLYRIVTPEKTYLNVNVTGARVVRDGASGAYFFTEVEISFIEVREVVAQYTSSASATQNAAQPSAKPPVNQGVLSVQGVSSRLREAVEKVVAPLRGLAARVGLG